MDPSRKKDISVALVIVASIIVMAWGYNFLKGKDFFKKYKTYNLVVDDAEGVLEGTLVFVNGVNVGSVSKVNLNPNKKVTVTFNLPDDLEVFKNTVADINAPDLLNGKAIYLEYQPTNGPLAKDGDTLQTTSQLSLMDKLGPKLDDIMPDLESSMRNINSLTASLDRTLNQGSTNDIQNTFSNLNQITANLNTVSQELTKNLVYLNRTLANTAQFTSALASNESKVNNALSNIESVTKNLAQSDFNQTVLKLDRTLENLNSILVSVDTTNGTLGMLLHDKGLYYRLNSTTESLNTLIDDIRANPKRYINVSVLGSRN